MDDTSLNSVEKLLQGYKCIVKSTYGGDIKINFVNILPNVRKCTAKNRKIKFNTVKEHFLSPLVKLNLFNTSNNY